MRTFHAIVHALPEPQPVERLAVIGEDTIRALELLPHQLHHAWPIDFNTAFDRLERLHRMFIELDGSWVWVGETDEKVAWQMDGLLNDSPQGLMTVEIKGSISEAGWNEFRKQLATAESALAFQLVQEGVYISEAEFTRRFLMPSDG